MDIYLALWVSYLIPSRHSPPASGLSSSSSCTGCPLFEGFGSSSLLLTAFLATLAKSFRELLFRRLFIVFFSLIILFISSSSLQVKMCSVSSSASCIYIIFFIYIYIYIMFGNMLIISPQSISYHISN